MHVWALGRFEGFRQGPDIARSLSGKNAGTLLGGLAIVLWASWPALSLQTQALPAFECMALIFLGAWAVTAALYSRGATHPGSTGVLRHRWLPALVFACGESGSTALFLLACRRIPAAEANLIIFLWPGLTVGAAALLGAFRLRARHLLGIALGFAGVAVLMGTGLSASLAGIGLALLGSLCWTGYCVFRLLWKSDARSPLALGFALCALLCAGVHVVLEPWVTPDWRTAGALLVIAVIPTAVANFLWDQGLRRGDGRLLAVMAYATPLCSSVLLTTFGLQAYSWRLAIGAVTIVGAGLLSRSQSLLRA